MQSCLLARRFCAKQLNNAAKADPAGAFDRHDIAGSQEAKQRIDGVIGDGPQPTPIRLGESVVECPDSTPHEEDAIDPCCGKGRGEFAV
jgi:hypothetical protein